MAIHARLGRRIARRGGSLAAGMTVATIDAVIAYVVLVAELDWLLSHYVLVRQIRRPREPQHSCQRQTRQKEAKEHTEPGDKIRAAVKNLRHVSFCTLVVSSPEGSRNQASHLDPDREVQTRIVIDAIVSNKTFANATVQQTYV